jgi:hypothetical protein
MTISVSTIGRIISDATVFEFGAVGNKKKGVSFKLSVETGKNEATHIEVVIFQTDKVNNTKLISFLTRNKVVEVWGVLKLNKNNELQIFMDRVEFIDGIGRAFNAKAESKSTTLEEVPF